MEQPRAHRVEFQGDTSSYFGVWIVNVCLTIATIGIYSAWAKVRNKRYFSQNTLIDGRRFDYHATGGQILIGRLIVLAGFIVLQIPFVNIIAILALLVAFPWLVNKALSFNARMTSFSGLRFAFHGSYWGAFKAYFLYPFLTIFTLYLAMPFAIRARHRYAISGHRFGRAAFGFDGPIGPFYRAFLMAFAWMFGALLLGFVLAGGPILIREFMEAARTGQDLSEGVIIRIFVLYALFFVAILPVGAIYQAYIRNAIYAGMSLAGGHRFQSDVSPMKLVWISISNAVAVVLSMGLMLPWARIRMARYLAASTTVFVAGSLDDFVAARGEEITALGDAYADLDGVDLGFQV